MPHHSVKAADRLKNGVTKSARALMPPWADLVLVVCDGRRKTVLVKPNGNVLKCVDFLKRKKSRPVFAR